MADVNFLPSDPDWELIDGVANHESFSVFWGSVRFDIPASESDGFTFPWFCKLMPLSLFDEFQGGAVAAFAHDHLCKNKDTNFLMPPVDNYDAPLWNWTERKVTKAERVQIFRDALEATGRINRRRIKLLWWGVRFGSRYLGTC